MAIRNCSVLPQIGLVLMGTRVMHKIWAMMPYKKVYTAKIASLESQVRVLESALSECEQNLKDVQSLLKEVKE